MGRHHLGRRRPALVPFRPDTDLDRAFRLAVAVGTLLLAAFLVTQVGTVVDGLRAERGGVPGHATAHDCRRTGGRQPLLLPRSRCSGTFVEHGGSAYPVEFVWSHTTPPRRPLPARVSAHGAGQAWIDGDRAWVRTAALAALLAVPTGFGLPSVVRVVAAVAARTRRRVGRRP